jgi:IPT/TIG domain-containing protein
LQDNGGPTETMAIASSSPAHDRANPQVCDAPQPNGAGSVDQRGDPRTSEAPGHVGCDIGAFELGLSRPVVTGLSPDGGTFLGGTSVTISGRNLHSHTVAVDFGPGRPASGVHFGPHGTLVASAPTNYPGTTVNVIVTTSVGASNTTPADRYTYELFGAG